MRRNSDEDESDMTSTDNVGFHLKNIFAGGELQEKATTKDSSVVQMEGGRRARRGLGHYNLVAIVSQSLGRAKCPPSAI